MFSFHKPKIYRSNNGCCICRAKSSSSRFTDSSKYEQEFEKCFRIREKRCGEICNACVLLVKRWKKLPDGTSRHWNHVVDARAGPGTKSTLKIKNKLSPSMQKYKSPLKSKRSSSSSPSSGCSPQTPTSHQSSNLTSSLLSQTSIPSPQSYSTFIPSPLPEELSGYDDSLDKSDLFSRGTMSDTDDSDSEDSGQGSTISQHINKRKMPEEQISPFLDLTYWKKTQVCCGIIFKGLHGEVLVDPQLLKPCSTCRKDKTSTKNELKRSTSLEDTDSNSSTPSLGVLDNLDFYNSGSVEPETPPESPPNSPPTNQTELDNMRQFEQCSKNVDFVANCSPITMEC